MRFSWILSTPLLAGLALASHAQTAQQPALKVPSWLQEGNETRLSQVHGADKISQIKLWAQNSRDTLDDLLKDTETLSGAVKREELLKGIQRVVEKSASLGTETFMRNILRRGVKAVLTLDSYGKNIAQAGILDQELRVLRHSIELALKYYQSDVSYLEGKALQKADLTKLPYASFGLEYAQFLMALNESILNAAAQYEIGVMALGLLHVDLSRDEKWAVYASTISSIANSLDSMPETAQGQSDPALVERMRQIRKAYLRATERLAQVDKELAEKIRLAQVQEQERKKLERMKVEERKRWERMNEEERLWEEHSKSALSKRAAYKDGSHWGKIIEVYNTKKYLIQWECHSDRHQNIVPANEMEVEILNHPDISKSAAYNNASHWGRIERVYTGGLFLIQWTCHSDRHLNIVPSKEMGVGDHSK